MRIAIAITIATAFTGSLLAYQPLRWTPMDTYIIEGGNNGPAHMEVILTDNGISSARFEYDNSGRLVKEIYISPEGSREGYAEYLYANGLLTEERVYQNDGELASTTRFVYEGGLIRLMKVFDGNGEAILTQQFTYAGNRLIGGNETAADGGTLEFQASYTGNRLTRITIRGEENTILSQVDLRYDANGRIIERIRTQDGSVSRYNYSYDNEGRILSYELANQVNGSWQVEKKSNFGYE